MPPATVNSANSRMMNGRYSSSSVCSDFVQRETNAEVGRKRDQEGERPERGRLAEMVVPERRRRERGQRDRQQDARRRERSTAATAWRRAMEPRPLGSEAGGAEAASDRTRSARSGRANRLRIADHLDRDEATRRCGRRCRANRVEVPANVGNDHAIDVGPVQRRFDTPPGARRPRHARDKERWRLATVARSGCDPARRGCTCDHSSARCGDTNGATFPGSAARRSPAARPRARPCAPPRSKRLSACSALSGSVNGTSTLSSARLRNWQRGTRNMRGTAIPAQCSIGMNRVLENPGERVREAPTCMPL